MAAVETRGGMPSESRAAPPGQLSQDTDTATDHVMPGAAPGVERPQPGDAPGAGGAFAKVDAPGDGGWARIDDVDAGPGWQQT